MREKGAGELCKGKHTHTLPAKKSNEKGNLREKHVRGEQKN